MAKDVLFKGTNETPHAVGLCDRSKADLEAVAALLELGKWTNAIGFSVRLALNYAKAYVKGETEVCFLTPEQATLLGDSNEEFIKALCEDGVIEWLTPLVLRRETREEAKTDG